MKSKHTSTKIFSYFTSYAITWTVAYIFSMYDKGGVDFQYYIEYLILAWTFTGLEIVFGIWFISIILFIPMALLTKIVLNKY